MLKIYLCDLTHTGNKVALETFALNIGFVASYAKVIFKDLVDISLYKYPEVLLRALRVSKPDVVAFSNYIWNNHLNEFICEKVKAIDPGIITVKGGPNFPLSGVAQRQYLEKNCYTDLYIPHEGEQSFVNLISNIIAHGDAWNRYSIKGGCFFSEQGQYSNDTVNRIEDLSIIPSPYLTGILDPFFDGKLTPVLERTRGCPFSCNYCNYGQDYYSRIKTFSVERIKEELHYIGNRIRKLDLKISNLIISDMNFGMYKEDLEIAEEIINCQQVYGWPMQLITTTGKNKIDKIAKVTAILGNMLTVFISLQSNSKPVLEEIGRTNIDSKMYLDLMKKLKNQVKQAELIVPLPKETYNSYLEAIKFLISAGVDKITNHTLQLNMGTPYAEKEYYEKFAYEVYYRPMANCFGKYDGDIVLEVEKVGAATNTLCKKEYLAIREFAFLIELIYNNGIFIEYFHMLKLCRVDAYSFVFFCFQEISQAEEAIQKAFSAFVKETNDELFVSEKKIFDFFQKQENFQHLQDGKLGRNVIFSNKATMLASGLDGLVSFVSQSFYKFIMKENLDISSEEQGDLFLFSKSKLSGIFNSKAPNTLIRTFKYDIIAWEENSSEFLRNYIFDSDVRVMFYFSKSQLDERENMFRMYGDNILGYMEILARVPNFEKMIRNVKIIS